MSFRFNRPGTGIWKLSPRETLIAFGFAIAVGYGLTALVVFFKALSSPLMRTVVYVEPWAVGPEMLLAFITFPVMVFGFLEMARTLIGRVRERKNTDKKIAAVMESIGRGEPI